MYHCLMKASTEFFPVRLAVTLFGLGLSPAVRPFTMDMFVCSCRDAQIGRSLTLEAEIVDDHAQEDLSTNMAEVGALLETLRVRIASLCDTYLLLFFTRQCVRRSGSC